MKTIITIYSTFPNQESATKVLSKLMDEKAIACYNTFPIKSSYEWKGKLNHDEEVASISKSAERKMIQIEELLEKHHPYDTPCILFTKVLATNKYADWVYKCIDLT